MKVRVFRLVTGSWAVVKPPLHVAGCGCIPEYVVLSHDVALEVALALVEKPSRCRDPWLPQRVEGIVANRKHRARIETELRRLAGLGERLGPNWGIVVPVPPTWRTIGHVDDALTVEWEYRPDERAETNPCPTCGHGPGHHLFGCCSHMLGNGTCGCTRDHA